eukprot:TRINITY_DN491_c0_g1_i1.p2 TRINITY_DN491_c0_g1~~TRINITY_DN491_c0_g1_i1.p2  ORF type:complete len:267 (-),score=47.83 TRINITY_DN491_c0_g1_i1:937-1737(-)
MRVRRVALVSLGRNIFGWNQCRTFKSLKSLNAHYKRKLVEMEKEKAQGIKWRMVGSAVVERIPQLEIDPPEWQQEYEKWHSKLWIENFLREEPDDEYNSNENEGKNERPGYTAEQMLGFARSRITRADRANDRKSLQRHLDKRLYLIVKKNRENHAWQFPQGSLEADETLKECAQRELREECGELKLAPIGNAPLACLKYEHTDEEKERTGFHGSKVFFYRNLYIGGKLTIDKNELSDYLWVAKKELPEYFSKDLSEVSQQMLWDP